MVAVTAEQVDGLRGRLRSFCYQMLGSPFDAEDAVQDVLERAWRARGQYDDARSSLTTWCFRIARNVCQYSPTSSVFTARAACTRDVRTRTLTCSKSSAYPTGSTAPDLAGVLTRPSAPTRPRDGRGSVTASSSAGHGLTPPLLSSHRPLQGSSTLLTRVPDNLSRHV